MNMVHNDAGNKWKRTAVLTVLLLLVVLVLSALGRSSSSSEVGLTSKRTAPRIALEGASDTTSSCSASPAVLVMTPSMLNPINVYYRFGRLPSLVSFGQALSTQATSGFTRINDNDAPPGFQIFLPTSYNISDAIAPPGPLTYDMLIAYAQTRQIWYAARQMRIPPTTAMKICMLVSCGQSKFEMNFEQPNQQQVVGNVQVTATSGCPSKDTPDIGAKTGQLVTIEMKVATATEDYFKIIFCDLRDRFCDFYVVASTYRIVKDMQKAMMRHGKFVPQKQSTKSTAIVREDRAFVHWYVGEGMEEGEFAEA